MVLRFDIDVPISEEHIKRNAFVYLPTAAKQNPTARFPVLYMFDGQNIFYDGDATYGKSWGLHEFLDYTDTPIIVAAIECNHGTHGERLAEYSPFSFSAPHLGIIEGKGKQTMDWLTQVFKPEIDAHFPTWPMRSHTFLAGSSMGGLMSLYGIVSYNHVFSRAAALSPSLWVAPKRLSQLIEQERLLADTILYMDYGSDELDNHPHMRQSFRHTTAQLLDKHILLNCRIVPSGFHGEASWERQIPFFMNTLLYGMDT